MEYSYINSFLPPDDEVKLMKYIGCENIFKLVFPEVSLDKKYISPLRKGDTQSGCFFWEAPETGLLLFVDFGNSDKTHLDPISFIQKYYNLNTYKEAIDFVKEKFKSSTIIDRVVDLKEEDFYREKIKKKIKVFPKNWSIKDKMFWQPYGITKMQLVEDGVLPVEYFQIFKGENFITQRPYSNSYAYSYEDGTTKIYNPYETDYKWITTTTKNTIGNLNNIDPTGEDLIITKSYKDCRVLRNLGYKNTIYFQSETQIPDLNNLLPIIKGYKRVLVFYDNDEAGSTYSNKFVKFMNNLLQIEKFYSIEIPDKNTKDVSDYYKLHSEQKTTKLIKKIIQHVKRKKN